jgi:hypothetical protein
MAVAEAPGFWDDLIALMEEHAVIPVVGPELLTVHADGGEIPFYRVIAARLLKRNGLEAAVEGTSAGDGQVVLHGSTELHDAVYALIEQRRLRARDLYRPIHEIIREVASSPDVVVAPLQQLARIKAFDLFACTTSDGLLAQALSREIRPGDPPVEELFYAPNLPVTQARDLGAQRPVNQRAMLYLFGRASASPFYAIHDEDALEFMYNLQIGRGPLLERMLSELRNRNVLLIGCNFATWLARFFIRFLNPARLASDRPKQEFIIEQQARQDRSLTLFLEGFSQNTRIYPGTAQAFVAELARRWDERNPPPPASEVTAGPPSPAAPPSPLRGRIFISYTRGDRDAARALLAEIEAIGGEGVAWLDLGEIEPGATWNNEITRALAECGLFFALVSARTEERDEGFFRREWHEAAERSLSIQGRRFIFPVVIDPDFDGDARYARVPDRFRAFQFSHAPGGHMTETLRETLTSELRGLRRSRPS